MLRAATEAELTVLLGPKAGRRGLRVQVEEETGRQGEPETGRGEGEAAHPAGHPAHLHHPAGGSWDRPEGAHTKLGGASQVKTSEVSMKLVSASKPAPASAFGRKNRRVDLRGLVPPQLVNAPAEGDRNGFSAGRQSVPV